MALELRGHVPPLPPWLLRHWLQLCMLQGLSLQAAKDGRTHSFLTDWAWGLNFQQSVLCSEYGCHTLCSGPRELRQLCSRSHSSGAARAENKCFGSVIGSANTPLSAVGETHLVTAHTRCGYVNQAKLLETATNEL